MNKEWIGALFACTFLAGTIGWFAACTAVKPVAQTAHSFADVCVELARIDGNHDLELACGAAADITELLSIRRRQLEEKDAGTE